MIYREAPDRSSFTKSLKLNRFLAKIIAESFKIVVIQLPSLLGPGSKPMQLFGLRKTPDLSHAPRQALGLRARTGSDPATGGW